MSAIVEQIPAALVWSRLGLGIGVFLLALLGQDASGIWSACFIVVGVLTDVFDGVVARRLKVSTPGLRVLDSRVDVAFFLLILAGLFLSKGSVLGELLVLGLVLGVLEVAVHLISFVRFGRESSTHHYLSKGFSVVLFALIVQIYLAPQITWLYGTALVIGVISYLEAALIMLSIPEWRTDIRSFYDVVKEKRRSAASASD